ncbi:hypothetical protein ACFOGJ_20105 [Marinibaculum pumilum]|uniref:DinB family protein n=1 Tax=Marinibaculum pumilum TaxID=1766165 RepID=A0ABV7L5M6_9PROT
MPELRALFGTAALTLILAATGAAAQDQHGQDQHRHQHSQHQDSARQGGHAMPAAPGDRPAIAPPREAGQGAFAALAEIVAMLEADPTTDWSRVDLDALRQHLVDMNALMLHAEAVAERLPDGLRMRVGGSGAAGAAVRRMVPAHARELDRIAGWTAAAIADGDEIVLTVSATEPGEVARIQGLGFFGLMATGAHHQAHHLAVARGEGMHAH